MSDKKSIEELMEFMTKKDDNNVKKCLRAILKEKTKERLLSEVDEKYVK